MAIAIVDEIEASRRQFDLAAPITREELSGIAAHIGQEPPMGGLRSTTARDAPLLKDIEEDAAASATDDMAPSVDADDYNSRYAHYQRCQALTALAAFAEGWGAFEEMVLRAYVLARRQENSDYRGDDPNRAFALRLRQQAAEDFADFIGSFMAEAGNVPKPTPPGGGEK